MPVYQNSDQLYDALQTLFNRIETEHPAAIQDVAKVGLTFRFSCNDPAGEIWIDGRQSPPATSFGPGSGKADLDVSLSADSLHEILLGRLFLVKALGAKKIQVKGPFMKAKALYDVFAASKAIYPDILREKGIRQ